MGFVRLVSLVAAFALGFGCAALINNAPAQIGPGTGVTVSGSITVGNCVQWLNATTIQDAGRTC